jgi:hypothetical protein
VVICTKCGFQNSDNASFCGSCGSFLEWTGEKVQPPAAPPPESEPEEPEPERGGIILQARRVLGLDGRPGGEAADAAADATGTSPEGGAATGSASVAPAPAAPAPVVVTTRRVAPAVEFAMTDTPVEAATAVPVAAQVSTAVEVAPPETSEATPIASAPVEPPPVVPAAVVSPPAVLPPVVPAHDVSAPIVPPPVVPAPPARPATTVFPPEWQALATEPPPVRPGPPQPLAQKPAAQRVPQADAVQADAVQADAVQPEAVKPGMARPRPAPTSVAAVDEAPRPGEVVCASCGTGNEATRRFCRRCGASLAATPDARRVPWWRRLFTRRAKATPAGARPVSVQRQAAQAAGGGGASLRKLLAVVLVGVVVVAAAGFVLVPGFHDAVAGAANQIRIDVAPNYVPVYIAGQATGQSIAGHGPTKAFDGFSNTCWAAPASAIQPSIQAGFSPPADIAKVLVTSGDPSDFESQPRPHTIRLDFMDAKGAVVFTKQFDLQDAKDFQTLDVDAKGAASMTITVLGVYQSTSGKNVSITEVEFRSRQ